METLSSSIDRVALETEFSGVVRVDQGGEVAVLHAYGLANRTYGIPHRVDTQLAIASGMKALTALVIVSLVVDDSLALTTTARSMLDGDLPLIAADVTIEHLLGHRSGIGDYIDESEGGSIDDYVMSLPVHRLTAPEHYLPMLDGRPTKFAAGTDFSYCNSGYVVLALIAERVTGRSFADLVVERVCEPARMRDTAFLRSDELPARAAIGYLSVAGSRTNVLHLPVVGGGDGGIYSTAADIHALWDALFSGRIVPLDKVAEMVRPHSDAPEHGQRYGLGFWLGAADASVALEGSDAGVSFRTVHDPVRHVTHTVMSNISDNAWPLARHIRDACAQ